MAGVFRWIKNSTITGLRLKDIEVHADDLGGSLAGEIQNSLVQDVTLENVRVSIAKSLGGALAGSVEQSLLVNIQSRGCVVQGASGATLGGLVGAVSGSTLYHVFVESVSVITVTSSGDDFSPEERAGGIAGVAADASSVLESGVDGAIVSRGPVGGIIGDLIASTIDSSYSMASLVLRSDQSGSDPSGDWVGGLAGYCSREGSVKNSVSASAILGVRDSIALVGMSDATENDSKDHTTIENSAAISQNELLSALTPSS
jgi:hypothetical protein